MFALHLQNHIQKNRIRRDGSRTAATSEMELVVIIVNGFQLYLDVAAVLDPPLNRIFRLVKPR